jgi:hypothetical protein
MTSPLPVDLILMTTVSGWCSELIEATQAHALRPLQFK